MATIDPTIVAPAAHPVLPESQRPFKAFRPTQLPAAAPPDGTFGYKLVVFLWILFLYQPARVLSYYIPPLFPLKWIPELAIYGGTVVWLASTLPKRHHGLHGIFVGLSFLGVLLAFAFGNWGIAREIFRFQILQPYLLGVLTLTFANTPARARTIFNLYFWHFAYYGTWGLISLFIEPIASGLDPAVRAIVFWHPDYENRDAFGPLMVAGLLFSLYYRQGNANPFLRKAALVSAVMAIIGILTSFGRGVFLAAVGTLAREWFRAERKIATLAVAGALVLVLVTVFPDFVQHYWSSMETIADGTETASGADRWVLWGFAWEVFLSSPIAGAGIGNFGIAVFDVVGEDRIVNAGYTVGRMWGRKLHSAPMTILSEYGLLGAIVILAILVNFVRTNRAVQACAAEFRGDDRQEAYTGVYIRAVSLGLSAVLLAIVLSSVFYEIFYTPLFWNLIVLHRLLFVTVNSRLAEQANPFVQPLRV